MTTQLLIQPKGSSQCGQYAMAMLTGESLETIFELYGTKGSTTPFKHKRVLDTLGYKHSGKVDVDNRKKDVLKPIIDNGAALIRIKFGARRSGHVMLYKDGKVYDSSRGIFNSIDDMLTDYNSNRHNVRVSYYILIY